MPTNKNKRKPGSCSRAAFVLALACALALPAAAFADTQLGLRVTDSSKSQGPSDPETGQPGSTQLGIRVTDSANPAPMDYALSFDSRGGTEIASRRVAVGASQGEPPAPVRDGYGFVAWYEAADLSGEPWDFSAPMPARDVVLHAKWTLRVVCDVPASAAIAVDASGNVTASSQTFTSSTVEPIVVTAVKSAQQPGASAVFADDATLANARVTLTPPTGFGSQVEVPLAAPDTGVAAAFAIPRQGELSVSFGLKLPAGARLSFDPGGARAVAQLSYVVAAAGAS